MGMTGKTVDRAATLPRALLVPLALTGLLGCGGGAAAVSTCATKATPDLSAQGGFDVDTGLPSSSTVGAGYGQPDCPGQFLVEADLQQQASNGKDFVVSAGWSSALPAQPCDERATMRVFVYDGTSWQAWDTVAYAGQAEGTICNPGVQSHTNAASMGLGATNVPSARHFQRVRVAASATESGSAVPVFVAGQFL